MQTPPDKPRDDRWTRSVQRFANATTLLLLGVLMVVVAIAALEMGWVILRDMLSLGKLPLEPEEIFDAFSFFLLILIGLDLINMLHDLYREGVVRVRFVLQAALISLAQSLIVLDKNRIAPMTMLGIAALIVALAVAILAIREGPERGHRT